MSPGYNFFEFSLYDYFFKHQRNPDVAKIMKLTISLSTIHLLQEFLDFFAFQTVHCLYRYTQT